MIIWLFELVPTMVPSVKGPLMHHNSMLLGLYVCTCTGSVGPRVSTESLLTDHSQLQMPVERQCSS